MGMYLSSLRSPSGLWNPYHISVALPLPDNPYTPPFSSCPQSCVLTQSRLVVPSLVSVVVCSNPVAPFVVVSDPMDAPMELIIV